MNPVTVIVETATLRIAPDVVKVRGDRFEVDRASGQLRAWLHFGQVRMADAAPAAPEPAPAPRRRKA